MSLYLKAARAQKNLTQEDVADALGIHVATYRKFEKLEASPTYEQANKIADMFGIPVEELIFLGNSTEKQYEV